MGENPCRLQRQDSPQVEDELPIALMRGEAVQQRELCRRKVPKFVPRPKSFSVTRSNDGYEVLIQTRISKRHLSAATGTWVHLARGGVQGSRHGSGGLQEIGGQRVTVTELPHFI